MSGFEARVAMAKQFEDEVEDYCQYFSDSVARNGTEHTHPDFVEHLRYLNDPASKFIRFAPDGVALLRARGVIHWEAKYANGIEKDAYETYMKYAGMGCTVHVFFKKPKTTEVYRADVYEIGFIPSEEVVGAFPVNRRHPIDEEGWMHPREGPGYRSHRASGTPYKQVDFGSLTRLEHFYDVLARVRTGCTKHAASN